MDVELIQWPAQADRRGNLAARKRPRLLLVATEADPPRSTDLLEDWVRLPVSDRDVRARVRDLQERVAAGMPSPPIVDAHSVLRHGSQSVALSELHGRLARVLVDHLDRVVSRADLTVAGWGDTAPARNTVDVHMTRLRRRVDEVGLSIRTVRNRGFILERVADGD